MALQLTIDNTGILEAIKDYVMKQGIDTAGKTLDIHIKAGRGTNGISTTVDIDTKGIDPGETPVTPEGPLIRSADEVPEVNAAGGSIFDNEE